MSVDFLDEPNRHVADYDRLLNESWSEYEDHGDRRVTKLRGKHERIGRHETPPCNLCVEFAQPLTTAQLEAFRLEWQARYSPVGFVTFKQPRKGFLERFWEAYADGRPYVDDSGDLVSKLVEVNP